MQGRVCLISIDKELTTILVNHYEQFGFEAQYFEKAKDAIDAVETGLFDVVVLDYEIPEGNAIGLLKIIRSKFLYLPILILLPASLDDNKIILEALEGGAFHYFKKPMSSIREFMIYNVKAMDTYKLRKEYQMLISEMAAREEGEESIDQITGLIAYNTFIKKMKKAASKAQKSGAPVSVIFIEIYQNDDLLEMWGENIFKEVLAHVGKIINRNLRANDIKSHVEKGMFAIGIELGDIACALHVTEKIKKIINESPFRIGESDLKMLINAGAASLIINEQSDLNNLISSARNALHQAKDKGPNRIELIPPML